MYTSRIAEVVWYTPYRVVWYTGCVIQRLCGTGVVWYRGTEVVWHRRGCVVQAVYPPVMWLLLRPAQPHNAAIPLSAFLPSRFYFYNICSRYVEATHGYMNVKCQNILPPFVLLLLSIHSEDRQWNVALTLNLLHKHTRTHTQIDSPNHRSYFRQSVFWLVEIEVVSSVVCRRCPLTHLRNSLATNTVLRSSGCKHIKNTNTQTALKEPQITT